MIVDQVRSLKLELHVDNLFSMHTSGFVVTSSESGAAHQLRSSPISCELPPRSL